MRQRGIIRSVITGRELRRLHLSYALFSLTEHATWLATIVYAFERGDVATAGRVAVVALACAVAVAPFAAYSGDRFRPDRALWVASLVQTVAVGATAIAMATDASTAAYVGAVISVCAMTMTRPLVGALLPLVSRRPADLVAGNVVIGAIGQLGLFAGPLFAGALLVAGAPALVFAVSTGMTAIGTAVVIGFRVVQPPPPTVNARNVVRQALAGLTTVARTGSLASVVAMMSAASLVGGFSDVVIVAFADERLGGGGGAAGVLAAGAGLGGVVGALVVSGALGGSRLTPYFATAALLVGLPLAAVPIADTYPASVVLLAATGLGIGLFAVLGALAIQRLSSPQVLTRVFGIQESLDMAALAVGAAAASVMIDRIGLGPALVWSGVVMSAVALVCVAAFAFAGADVPPPPASTVDRVIADPLFAHLGVRAIERLATAADVSNWSAGADIVTQGEVGDRYFLLVEGTVEVIIDGEWRRRRGPGESFGEIALLEDCPRTATVRAETEVVTLAIGREVFLEAVTDHPMTQQAADAIADRSVR